MTRRIRVPLLLACVAAAIACGGDRSLGPPTALRGHFELGPVDYSVIEPGDTLRLVAALRDQRGRPVQLPAGAVAYASASPAVASVSSTGLVTGVAPGHTTIRALLPQGQITYHAATYVIVLDPTPVDLLLMNFSERGWQPSIARVAAGGTVRWATNQKTMLWFTDADYRVVDSLDLRGGSATRRFETPGTVRYCTGGCWDPQEWGVIHIE